jgi:hypothetical protein
MGNVLPLHPIYTLPNEGSFKNSFLIAKMGLLW